MLHVYRYTMTNVLPYFLMLVLVRTPVANDLKICTLRWKYKIESHLHVVLSRCTHHYTPVIKLTLTFIEKTFL